MGSTKRRIDNSWDNSSKVLPIKGPVAAWKVRKIQSQLESFGVNGKIVPAK